MADTAKIPVDLQPARADFTKMLVAQWNLQRESFGADPCLLPNDDVLEFIRWNYIALIKELGEMMDEISWKPWASARFIHGEAGAKEMVDAFHFFMNILLALGPHIDGDGANTKPGAYPGNVQELALWFEEKYFAKRQVNAARQAQGYDGVSSKCSACYRELSEAKTNGQLLCGEMDGCPFLPTPGALSD